MSWDPCAKRDLGVVVGRLDAVVGHEGRRRIGVFDRCVPDLAQGLVVRGHERLTRASLHGADGAERYRDTKNLPQ